MQHFIINPKSRSGKGKSIWAELEPIVKKSTLDHEIIMTEQRGHAMEIAEKLGASSGDSDAYFVMGGDGTLNEVMTGLVRAGLNKPLVGSIPTGSGNDFCRCLGLPSKPAEALDHVYHARSIKDLDHGTVMYGDFESRPFLVSSGIGHDADVCNLISKSKIKNICNRLHIGKIAFSLLGFKAAVTYKKASGQLTLDNGDRVVIKNLAFLSCHNLCCEGGGWKFAPGAVPDDGKLDICIVCSSSRIRALLTVISSKLKNGLQDGKSVRHFKVTSAHLKLDQKLTCHADGEILGRFDELTFRCEPRSVRLMVR